MEDAARKKREDSARMEGLCYGQDGFRTVGLESAKRVIVVT